MLTFYESALCAALGILVFIIPVISKYTTICNWSLFLEKFQLQITINGVTVLCMYVCMCIPLREPFVFVNSFFYCARHSKLYRLSTIGI